MLLRPKSARSWLAAVLIAGLVGAGFAAAGAALAEQDPQQRASRLFWRTGPLGRYQYPALLWAVDSRDQRPPGQPPDVFRRENPPVIGASAAFDGQFVDAETGRPITEVEAIIQRKDGPTEVVLTDSRGRFSAPEVPTGEYTIASHAAGYYDEKETVTLTPNRTHKVELRLHPRPAAFAGHLRDPEGEPVAGAKLVVKDARGNEVHEGETLRDGSFGVGSLSAGRYTLELTAGERTVRNVINLQPGEILTLDLSVR